MLGLNRAHWWVLYADILTVCAVDGPSVPRGNPCLHGHVVVATSPGCVRIPRQVLPLQTPDVKPDHGLTVFAVHVHDAAALRSSLDLQ